MTRELVLDSEQDASVSSSDGSVSPRGTGPCDQGRSTTLSADVEEVVVANRMGRNIRFGAAPSDEHRRGHALQAAVRRRAASCSPDPVMPGACRQSTLSAVSDRRTESCKTRAGKKHRQRKNAKEASLRHVMNRLDLVSSRAVRDRGRHVRGCNQALESPPQEPKQQRASLVPSQVRRRAVLSAGILRSSTQHRRANADKRSYGKASPVAQRAVCSSMHSSRERGKNTPQPMARRVQLRIPLSPSADRQREGSARERGRSRRSGKSRLWTGSAPGMPPDSVSREELSIDEKRRLRAKRFGIPEINDDHF